MKVSGFMFLIIAALSSLLIFCVSPAWTYYPPVAATATNNLSSLTLSAFNPKTQTGFSETFYAAPGDEFSDMKQQNGVIAYVFHSGANYYVTCCTYDIVLNPSNLTFSNAEGPFASVSQLQVVDGVVAYVVGMPGDGHLEPRYATYDPAKQAWQLAGHSWYLPGMEIQSIATKDGVVLWQWYWPGMPTPYAFDCYMYDPILGIWWGSGMDNWKPFQYITIDNASVHYAAPVPGGGVIYDTFGCIIGSGNGWHLGTATPPQAYFVAQPTSGHAPLWVWFTDMSIGATEWSWNFGDGNSSTNRSTYHTYLSKGTYQAYQSAGISIPVPVISMRDVTIKVGAKGIGHLLPLLLQ